MTVKHMKSGEDFFDGGDHFGEMKDFGFGASVNKPTMESGRTSKSNVSRPGGAEPENFAKGGHEHGTSEHSGVAGYAEGGVAHPLGNDVVGVEQKEDGSTIHHHGHGGFSIHHPMGGISHHMADGTPAMGGITSDGSPPGMAHGGHMKHPHGDAVHGEMRRADGGRVQCHAHGGMTIHHPDGHVSHHDANGMPLTHGEGVAMVKSGLRQHEDAEHGGKHEGLNLAHGGVVGHRAHLPRGMKPRAERPSSPINTPPRNPMKTMSAPNDMPGGVAPYGVQPSSEPEDAGSGQDIPQLNRGGHMKRHGRE